MTAPAVRPSFTKAEALTHSERLNASIDETLDLIFEAWVGRIWEALDDVSDWETYVDSYAPRIKSLKLPVVDRRGLAAKWAAAGAPTRDFARAANVSNGTAAGDYAKVVPLDAARKVISKDGSLRPQRTATVTALPSAEPEGLTQVERAIWLVEQAGERGLTVRDLSRKTGWHHGTASAALSKAHRRRHAIAPVLGVSTLRDGCAPYVLVEVTA